MPLACGVGQQLPRSLRLEMVERGEQSSQPLETRRDIEGTGGFVARLDGSASFELTPLERLDIGIEIGQHNLDRFPQILREDPTDVQQGSTSTRAQINDLVAAGSGQQRLQTLGDGPIQRLAHLVRQEVTQMIGYEVAEHDRKPRLMHRPAVAAAI